MNFIVSVCIPTYNGARYLRECIDSILAQTFTDFEILIIDDCSSDETPRIIHQYAIQNRRIRVEINERNLGLVGNWNRCIELARGEWIKFVFQDDLLEPQCLERMLVFRTADSVMISSRRHYIFEDSIPEANQKNTLKAIEKFSLETVFPGKTEISAKDYCKATLDFIGENFVGEPTSILLRKSVFDEFGLFNPNLISFCDMEFWDRVAVNKGMIYIPEILTKFRVHNESTTANNRSQRFYRSRILDRLIILHDFAFNPAYEPLRAVSRNEKSVALENLLADKAYEAKKMADRAANDSANPDATLLEEWNCITQLYPLLSKFSKRSLSKQILVHGLYRWKQLKRKLKI